MYRLSPSKLRQSRSRTSSRALPSLSVAYPSLLYHSDDMEKGLNDTKKAVVSARSARKMRWWCFGVILVVSREPLRTSVRARSSSRFPCTQILIVVVIVVVVEVVIPLINKKNDNNAAPASSAAPAVSRTSAAALIAASQTSASVIAIASVTARLLV